MKINWILLICFILLCNLLGSIGGIWAGGDSDWYKNLNKSRLNPPSWVFAPVWFLLFTLMGVVLYFIWTSPVSQLRTILLLLFTFQFVLNILWSFLFFGIQNPLLAFIEIIFFEILLIIMIFILFPLNRVSFWLWIPYILWVGFASFLNLKILRFN
jgi:benzodiazapine receptor